VLCGGLVESLRTPQLFNPRSDAVLKRWHVDNLRHKESVAGMECER
jgi:hypothetical protein